MLWEYNHNMNKVIKFVMSVLNIHKENGEVVLVSYCTIGITREAIEPPPSRCLNSNEPWCIFA